MTVPLVSILMVARNAARYIDVAIRSAREQSFSDIEIVIVDDGSRDDTAQIARTHAQHDERVRLFEGPQKGLSAVRNISLDAARGRFAMVLDSDDILHPRHVEWLIAGQVQRGAEICATNMIEFREEGPSVSARPFAGDRAWLEARQVELQEFVARGMMGGKGASLGYLKPMFDLAFLRANAVRYDESLRIGEDFDLVVRSMLAGARYHYLPHATYYYRRHAASISHRLAHRDLEGLLSATNAYSGMTDKGIASIINARRKNLEAALLHLDVIAAIKAGKLIRAFKLSAGHQATRRMTLSTLYEAVAKRIGMPDPSGRPAQFESLGWCETITDRLHALTLAQPLPNSALTEPRCAR